MSLTNWIPKTYYYYERDDLILAMSKVIYMPGRKEKKENTSNV